MKLYTCSACDQMIELYEKEGGEIETIEEGTLGYGFMILFGEGLKTTVIQEVPLNEWNSAHKIRCYNQMPKKYRKILEDRGLI